MKNGREDICKSQDTDNNINAAHQKRLMVPHNQGMDSLIKISVFINTIIF